MYSGPGTQVCTNLPPPAFNSHSSNSGYPRYANGYPNPSYFTPANYYQYSHQDYHNFSPIDTRFTQLPKDQVRNVFQAPGLPMPPMNIPAPCMQFNGRFPFPAPMQPHTHYSMPPPNGMIMNPFPNPPPYPPPCPDINHQSNGRSTNRKKFHSFRQTDRKFTPVKAKSFHCGSCDKDFSTAHKYDQHVAEHVGCCLDGCTFKAHPSIVEKHIAMQHRSGLYKRIVKGNSPEEIDQWVTDRKRHYPTLGKINEKQVQKIEMEKRGERYDDRRRRFPNQHVNGKDTQNRLQFSYGNRKSLGYSTKKSNCKSDNTNRTPNRIFKTPAKKREHREIVPDNFEFYRNLPAFRGTRYYLQSQTENKELDCSDSDPEEGSLNFDATSVCDDEVSIPDKSFSLISSLDLIRGYDSSESSNDGWNEANSTAKMKPKLLSSNDGDDSGPDECSSKLHTHSQNEDDESGPEECSSKLPVPKFILQDSVVPVNNKVDCVEIVPSDVQNLRPENKPSVEEGKEDLNTSKKSTRKRVHKKSRNEKVDEKTEFAERKKDVENETKSATILPPSWKRFKRPTLLAKLLAPEIRHERNTILQCIRYVVNNNYFNIGSASRAGTSTLE